MLKVDYGLFRTRSTERIDVAYTLMFPPVPTGIFEATKERIEREMAILKKAGRDPARVTALAADGIIKRERADVAD